jgi:diacylglycerol kinase family enzyme
MSAKVVALIYNPFSGYIISDVPENVEGYFQQLTSACSREELIIKLFSLSGDPELSLLTLLETEAPDQIWVAGGDGSVLSVAKLARKLDIPMGVIPCGTMNLMARDLGMSLDPEEAVKQLCSAQEGQIDMAMLNGKPFLCLSNIGMSTRLTDRRESLRKHSGWIRWPLMAWYMVRFMFSYPKLTVHLKLGNQVHSLQTRSISISNNPLSPDSSLMPTREALDQGELGVYVARDRSIWSLPRLILRLLVKNWHDDKDMIRFKSDEVRVNFIKPKRLMKVMTDGELSLEQLPLDYAIQPSALKVLRPKGCL